MLILGGTQVDAQNGPPVGVDHIILYTGSLAQGSAAFARLTGVVPAPGGQHPGRGTQNSLVSLGHGKYLEILAPVVDSGPAEPLRPSGWAVHTPDLDALRERLQHQGVKVGPIRPGSRRTLAGALLDWRTADLGGDDSDFMPFFIEWGKDVLHPSTTSPDGCILTEFVITGPDTTRLEVLVRSLDLGVTVRAGPVPAATVTLQCPRGVVRFTSQ